jgi:hypothetical protein
MYKSAIRAGRNGANGRVDLLRVNISNIGIPSSSYPIGSNPDPDSRNRDAIDYLDGNGPLFVRDSILKDVSDAAIDSHGPWFAARGSRFENGYRLLRLWPGTVGWIEESTFVGPTNIDNWAYVWFGDRTSKLYVLRSTFDGAPTIPRDRCHLDITANGLCDDEAYNNQIVYLDRPEGLLLDPFIRPGVPGDYNDNGTVDAADYVLWRKYNGQSVALANDGTPNTVSNADYDMWRANYGMTVGSSSGAGLSASSIPEPASAMLLILAAVAIAGAFCGRRWK